MAFDRAVEAGMRMVIEARFLDGVGEGSSISLGTIERGGTLDDAIGLSLAEGRALLASAQQCLVCTQCQVLSALQAQCAQCGKQLTVKGQHQRQMRTVFGCVQVSSPRLRRCACHGDLPGASFSRLVAALPTQMSPELEYLQVKWAAHLPLPRRRSSYRKCCQLGIPSPSPGCGAEFERSARNWTARPR